MVTQLLLKEYCGARRPIGYSGMARLFRRTVTVTVNAEVILERGARLALR